MAPCCGRPNTRPGKSGYASRYAYQSSSQISKLEQAGAAMCHTCAAFTVGDPCSVCGLSKTQPEANQEEDKTEE